MNRLLSLALAAVAALCAGNNAQAQVAYGYPHSIDLQTGYTASLLKVDGLSQRAVGISDGTSFSMRYTGYMTRHFGVYAGMSFSGSDLNDRRYFAIVNRADGNAYRYGSDYLVAYRHNYAPIFSAGIATRFDFGQVSIRPRVGIGSAAFKMRDVRYTMKDGASDMKVQISQRPTEYLIDDTFGQRRPSFMMEGTLQMTYTFWEHLYVSAEAGLQVIPELMTVDTTRGSRTTSSTMSIPDIANLKLGIGWNIGWNRNYRHGLRRSMYF